MAEKEKQIEKLSGLLWLNPYVRLDSHNASMLAQYLTNEGYRKQEWISVNDRLPENYRPVLVACEGLTIGGYAPIAIGSYGGGLWSLADADGTAYLTKYMRCTVTHWMPLPEPPKGE
jgi:hypothetical protein